MSTHKPTTPPSAPDAYEPLSLAETIEDDASHAEVAVGEALRGIEVAGVVLLGLLICPPLAILVVVVVVPLALMTLALGLLAAIVSTPYLLVHHFRAPHRGHGSLFAHRLRGAGHALYALMPHRIVADARKLDRAGR